MVPHLQTRPINASSVVASHELMSSKAWNMAVSQYTSVELNQKIGRHPGYAEECQYVLSDLAL